MSMSGLGYSHNTGACCSICRRSCRQPDLLWQAAACPVLKVGHFLALSTFCDLTFPALARPAAIWISNKEFCMLCMPSAASHSRFLVENACHLGCKALPDSDDSLIKDLVSFLCACTRFIASVTMCCVRLECAATRKGLQETLALPAVDCPGSFLVADVDAQRTRHVRNPLSFDL